MFTQPSVSQPDATTDDVNFACIITAYGSASIAVDLVKSILLQSHKAFHIYVVADNCSDRPKFPESTLLSVIYPPTPLHGKIKSIQLAIENFKANHSHVLILDADNLLYKHTLQHLAKTLESGKYIAVQGQRTAKNLDTKIAALDALSELYYNVTQRLVTFQLGSSATIAGSGMAIETNFFKSYVDTLLNHAKGVILAEDKLLQMMLVEKGHKIAYNKKAVVFDEKVREGAQVQRQRTRWLRSWFDHWGEAIGVLLKGIGNLSWNQFFFGLTLSVPPMLFIVGGLGIFSIIGLLISWPLFILSISGLVLFFGGFLLSLIIAPAPKAVWQAIPYIPLFAIRQILAILHIKASNKDFMATTHTQFTDIEHVWALRKNDFPYLKNEA
jgi:cellulose synthase/poly-beta-1,6-N-acetylglucosamine synthase-like glycosyltransferase